MTLLEKIQSVDDENYRRIGHLLVSYPREWSPAIGVYLSLRFQNVKLAHYLHIQNPIALWFDVDGGRKFLGEIYFGSESLAEVKERLGIDVPVGLSVEQVRELIAIPGMTHKLAACMTVPKRCPGLDYPREPMNSNCPECNDTGEINLFSSTSPCDCRKDATPLQTSEKTATQVMAEAFAHPPKTVEELQGEYRQWVAGEKDEHDLVVEDYKARVREAWGRRQVEIPPHVAKLINDSPFGQYTAAEICAAQPMTQEGLFQSGLKDVSSERGRQHLEQYKSFADRDRDQALQCSAEIDRLALWFTTNASVEIKEGSAVDNAIAYMERLRAVEALFQGQIDTLTWWFRENAPDEIGHGSSVENAIAYMERLRAAANSKAVPEETVTSVARKVITVPFTVTGNLISGGCKIEASESSAVKNNSFLEEPQSDRERAAVAAHMKCMQEERQENEVLVQMLEDQMLKDQLSNPPGD